MRFAICNEGFEGWALRDVVAFVADVGYEGLELAPFTLCDDVRKVSEAERRKIRCTIESAGLKVVGLHWLLAYTEGLQLNDPDPAVRGRTTQYLLALVDFCADLGGQVLVFGSPKQRSLQPGWVHDEALDSAAEIFRRCGERAAERDVVFCLEPLTTLETDFITTALEAAKMVRAVAHPGFQMMVDVRAMSSEDRPIPEIIRGVAPYIQHVHLNDPNQLGPGMGEVDFVPILRTLREVGYEGWLSVEPFDFSPGPERIARENLAYLKRCVERIDE
ncbi:MAG: sugar phosphate isomerase/epimerase family protein [Chloroflexota bacterium]|nr:sugar phosphate isomerase/epimerase family protein [Chloroflexota bacterium]